MIATMVAEAAYDDVMGRGSFRSVRWSRRKLQSSPSKVEATTMEGTMHEG